MIGPGRGPRRAPAALALPAFLLSALVASGPAMALDPARRPSQYVHERWGVSEGLPQVTARALLQTRDGYLWFGTQEGLVRFDGARFTVFDRTSAPGIGGNGVNSIAEDPDGTLWIGRDEGLSRYRDGEVTAVDLSAGLALVGGGGVRRRDAELVLAARNGDLWIAVNGGLLRRREGRFRAFTPTDGLADETVSALLEGSDGSVWIGTPRGLSRVKDDRLTRIDGADGLLDGLVSALAEDGEGGLWIGTPRGLVHLRDGIATRWPYSSSLPAPRVQAILRDRDGTLWLGTVPAGLSRFRDGELTSLVEAPGLSDGDVVSLLEDREGSLWIGTATAGLHRLRDGKLTPFGRPEGLSSEMTSGLWEDPDGGVWVGTHGSGVDLVKDGRVTPFTARQGVPASDASALAGVRDGTLWIGTNSGALGRLGGGRVTTVSLGAGAVGDAIRALHVDRRGTLWIGGNYGLTRLEAGVATRFTVADGLPHRAVLAFAEEPDGTLWIATASGICRMRGDRIETPPATRPLEGRSCFSLLADGTGTLWVGTLGAGLAWLRDGRLTTVTEAQGLHNGTVLAVLDDGLGSLWMSCNRGIHRVPRDDLAALAERRTTRVATVVYGVPDGMRSPECNRGGAIRTRDGKLWFSTVRGLVAVDPRRMRSNVRPPTVLVEEVRAAGRATPAPPKGAVRLPAGTGPVEIRYTATSLSVPERVRFRYRLEGYDEEWLDAGSRRTAFYDRLPPGTYTFRVLACNDDGVWNEEGARLGLAVSPHPWQTWWFVVLEALAGAALLGAVLVAQRRRLERRRIEELRRADLARKTEELEYARRVQIALLPKAPLRSGSFEVAGETRTATEVGGDYFGYFPAGPGRLAVVIGDATGHGVAAGLVVGMAKAVLESLRLGAREGGPAEWLRAVNEALRASIAQRGLGMCLGLVHLEEATGRALLSVAGVPHAYLCRAGGTAPERLEASGPPLGYLSRIEPETVERRLGPGDRLVLFTDGLVEQRGAAGRMWDYEGVEAALASLCARDVPPLHGARALLDACERFAGGAPRDDDQTVVVLRRDAALANPGGSEPG